MRSLVGPFSGEIEHSADEVAAGTSKISVKRAAIRWKIEGVPALRSALFQPNPFTSVFDTWVLMYQMANYFESGTGRVEFGPAAPHAVDTCLRMEDELNRIVATFVFSHDVTKVRVAAKKWAIEHPIRYRIDDRETTLSRVTEQDVGVKWTAGDLIAEVEVTADDINREIQIYSDQLLHQAAWEADLMKLDFPTAEALPLAERAVPALPWRIIGLVWVYALVWMVVLDLVKLGLHGFTESRESEKDTFLVRLRTYRSASMFAAEAPNAKSSLKAVEIQKERMPCPTKITPKNSSCSLETR
jgi:hypothetical protein